MKKIKTVRGYGSCDASLAVGVYICASACELGLLFYIELNVS